MRQGRLGHFVAAGLVAVLAASPALAQQVDPTKRQNVAASVGDTGKLETQRQALFKRMLADPSNLDLAFEYAALSQKAGDLEAAIATLERMLVFAPGLPRLQFELGVLYYRLGSWNTAKSYFTTVLAAPQTPAEIKTQIGAYMGTIKAREEGSQSFGMVSVGARYQTNANAGPDSPLVNLGGITFTLDEDALSTPDTNGFVTARLHNSKDLESQGDRFETDLSAYGALYSDKTDLDTGLVELALGPSFNLQRYHIDNARLALKAKLGAAMLGGDPYLATYGLGADLTLLLDAKSRLTLGTEAKQNQYFDSDLRPTSSDRTGQTYSASARIDYVATPDVMLFAKVDADRNETAEDYLSNWSAELSGGLVWELKATGDAKKPWVVSLTGSYEYKLNDAPDTGLGETEAQTTDVATISAGLSIPFGDGMSVDTGAFYSLSKSNYDMSNFDNLGVSIALSKKW